MPGLTRPASPARQPGSYLADVLHDVSLTFHWNNPDHPTRWPPGAASATPWPADLPERPGSRGRIGWWCDRHRYAVFPGQAPSVCAAFGLGIVVRLITMLGFPPAIWFGGDSASYLWATALYHVPQHLPAVRV